MPRRHPAPRQRSRRGARRRPAPVRRYRPAPSRRSPGTVPLVLAGLVVTYGLSLGIFALAHYDGPRPDPAGVMRDFHGWLGLGPSPARAAPEPPPPAPTPPAPPAPAPVVPREPSPLDRVAETLQRVEREAPGLRGTARGPAFDEARIGLLNLLTDARDTLGAILDAEPDHDRANRLWDRLQYLMAAIRKL